MLSPDLATRIRGLADHVSELRSGVGKLLAGPVASADMPPDVYLRLMAIDKHAERIEGTFRRIISGRD